MNVFQKPANVCAAAMIGFFFLPWAQMFGMGASGYNLSQMGSYGNWAWAIPILAGLTLISVYSGSTSSVLPVVTGVVPFVGLAYGLWNFGGDIFHVLAFGSYLTLIAGAGIIVTSSEDFVWESSASQRSSPTSVNFCTECGTKSSSKSAFCNECGAKVK